MVGTSTVKFLLALALFSLCGHCHGQCEVLNEDNMTKIHHCNQLYSVLEQALISSEDNLFVLRETFFSSQHPTPHIMFVYYHLQINGRDIKIPVVWTAVSLFKFVSPFTFLATEPSLFVTAFILANVQIFPSQNGNTIHLPLAVNINEFSINEVMDILYKLTTKVRRHTVRYV